MNSREIDKILSDAKENDVIIIKCGNTVVEGCKKDLKYFFNRSKTLLYITNTARNVRGHYLLTTGRIYAIEHYF